MTVSIAIVMLMLVALCHTGCRGSMPAAAPTNSIEPTAIPTYISGPSDPPTWPTGVPVVLFYHSGYLYRTDIEGNSIERLTAEKKQDGYGEEIWRTFLIFPPRVSPDGRWMIESDSTGHWRLLDLQEGLEMQEGRGQPRLSPTWAPDSQQFAYLANDQLCIYNLPSETVSCSFQKQRLLGALWSPTGSQIAVVEADAECCTGKVWLIEMPQGKARIVGDYSTMPEGTIDELLAWSPDGLGLLIKSVGSHPAVLFSLKDNTSRPFSEPVIGLSPGGQHLLYASSVMSRTNDTDGYSLLHDSSCEGKLELQNWAWSPDGRRLAYVTPCAPMDRWWAGPSSLYVVDVGTGELLWKREIPDISLRIVRWSHDGQYLLLDRVDPSQETSPIWRLQADGKGELKTIVEQGLFLDVVPQWGER